MKLAATKQPTNQSNQAGFSLLELMIVVVIMALLATLLVPKIMDRPDKARLVKAKQDIRSIESALQMYKLDNFVYPSTDQGLEALVSQPSGEPEVKNWKSGGYLDRVPQDPWGREYLYLSPGDKGDVDIFTYGADGQEGGEGVNADLGNWNLDSVN